MRVKLGEYQNHPVNISEESPNEHILLLGTSGSGKSTRLKEIMDDCYVKGRTVIAFDINGCDFVEARNANVISALDDGININFFNIGNAEDYVNQVAYIVEAFSNIASLGIRQERAFRDAVEFALKNNGEFANGMEALEAGLRRQSSEVAEGVLSKFWGLFESNIFRENKKRIVAGEINVVSIQGVNSTTQRQVVELVLCELWQKCRSRELYEENTTIIIDEFQHLSLKRNSVLLEMLREARKYGINIILSTQTSALFSKEVLATISLTAIQLYFRPAVSDMKKIAELICPEEKGKWLLVLKSLKIGESVVNGNFCIGKKNFDCPIVIHSAYQDNSSMLRKIY